MVDKPVQAAERLKTYGSGFAYNVIETAGMLVVIVGPGLPAIGIPAPLYTKSDLETAVRVNLLIPEIRRINVDGIDRGDQKVYVLR